MSRSRDQRWRDAARFVRHLEALADPENPRGRAALAALRRGLGKEPGSIAEIHQYVLPALPAGLSTREEDRYYLIAGLYASYPGANWRSDDPTSRTDLGASFARARGEDGGESVERRFVALLNCHEEDLPYHLRHAVSFLGARQVPIDWARLLVDIESWGHEERFVQRAWARSFWAPGTAAPSGEGAQPAAQVVDVAAS